MVSHKSNNRPITPSAAMQAVPWQLPEVTGTHIVALERKRDNSPLADALKSSPPEVGLVLQPEKPAQDIEDDVVTVSEAEEIREAAYQEGLLQGLVEGREKGYPEGLKKGLAEGTEKGYAEALQKGQAEVDQAVASLAKMIQSLEQPLADQAGQLESLVSELVIKLAKATVEAELNTRPELIQQAVQKAFKALPQGGGEVVVRCAPSDQPHLEQLSSHLNRPVSVVADAAIYSGSFQLQTENTLVAADIQAQFDHLAEQLFSSLDGEPEQEA